jgi:hypothetical protein
MYNMLGGRIMGPETGVGHAFLSPVAEGYRTLTGRQEWTRRSSRRTCLEMELVVEREWEDWQDLQTADMGRPGGQKGMALASPMRRPVTPWTRPRESVQEVLGSVPILPVVQELVIMVLLTA